MYTRKYLTSSLISASTFRRKTDMTYVKNTNVTQNNEHKYPDTEQLPITRQRQTRNTNGTRPRQRRKERKTYKAKNIYCWSLVSARVDFDPPASIYFIFSTFPRSRNITAPHQIFVGISLIFKLNGI